MGLKQIEKKAVTRFEFLPFFDFEGFAVVYLGKKDNQNHARTEFLNEYRPMANANRPKTHSSWTRDDSSGEL